MLNKGKGNIGIRIGILKSIKHLNVSSRLLVQTNYEHNLIQNDKSYPLKLFVLTTTDAKKRKLFKNQLFTIICDKKIPSHDPF